MKLIRVGHRANLWGTSQLWPNSRRVLPGFVEFPLKLSILFDYAGYELAE